MYRLGLRCLALIIVPLVLTATVSCDDEEELVCCQCTCYTVINPTLGTEEEETEIVSGKGISCKAECSNHCSQMNWDIRAHSKVDCPDKLPENDTTK